MEAGSQGKKAGLNDKHPELDGGKDEYSRPVTKHAPIVWELLRRSAEIAALREELANLMGPEPLHTLLVHGFNHEVSVRFGFELELSLIACGLNAWVTTRPFPSTWHDVPPGTWPLEGYWKRRFEELMGAYRHSSVPKNGLLDFWPAMNILDESHQFGAALKKIGVVMKSEVSDEEALSALVRSPSEIPLIAIRIRTCIDAGYGVCVAGV
jgi:hypothetical protein